MRREILRFSDSNMAGFEWTWIFILEKQMDDTLSLSAEQKMADPEDDDYKFAIEPAHKLRRGADVYKRLDEMLSLICVDLELLDVAEIAKSIEEFDTTLAGQFQRGAELLERRAQRRARREKDARLRTLEPFKNAIHEYCENLDDQRTRGGGGILRPSERARVKAFLESYVCRTGKLPSGQHTWHLSNGFMSGSHDFGSLGDKT